MDTCFVFTSQLIEINCLSLRLDQQGQVISPLAWRSFDEIKTLQMEARTVVVVPTELTSLHELGLPWLGERKARAAIPYALEEQLAQQVTDLHFAFDRQYYKNNQYLVAVIDKQVILDLTQQLNAVNLEFDAITLDWFALNEDEACFTETSLLVHDKAFKGALSLELATVYLDREPLAKNVYLFNDSPAAPISSDVGNRIDSSSHLWIAQRLLQNKPMNLCQGEFQQGSSKQRTMWWYQGAAVLFLTWLISVVAVNALNSYALTKKIAEIDRQTGVIYREFFPNAPQVVSPRFRINQLLKAGTDTHDNVLWQLLNKLALAFDASQFTIEQLRFQNQLLAVTLNSQDFAALEGLQLRLKNDGVKVTQTQASSREQKVVAILELGL